MVVAALATVALFGSTVLDGLLPWAVLLGTRLILGSVALAAATSQLHQGEAAHLRQTLRPLAICLPPSAWLVLQLLPLPFAANPVWESAAAALPGGAWGHITIDVSATWFSLLSLLLAALIATTVATQTTDRVRAENALLGLTAAAFVLPAISVALSLRSQVSGVARLSALECLSIGALLVLACVILAYERFETRQAGSERARSRIRAIAAAGGVVILCCLATAELVGGAPALLACLASLLTLASLSAARRFGWGIWFVFATLALIGLGFVFVSIEASGVSGSQVAGLSDIGQQLRRNAPWLGSGGGTAAILSGLYATLSDPAPYAVPNISEKLLIELGGPACLVLLLLAGWLEIVLVRDALRRGRDSVYPMVGASLVPGVLIMSSTSLGLFGSKAVALTAGVMGLALSQRQSRSVAR